EGDRARGGSRGVPRARRPRPLGAAGRGRADDRVARARRPAPRGVSPRRLLDGIPRGDGGATTFAGRRGPLMARARPQGRRAARRTALFLLYQWDVTGQPLTSLYEGSVDP